jgi:hypothetical protein
MASVVTFWQLPGEESALFRYLATNSDVVGIRHCEAVSDPKHIRVEPISTFIGRQDRTRVYMTLRFATDPLSLHVWEPEKPGNPILYSLPVEFPAIVYDAGAVVEGRLSLSNTAAHPSRVPAEVEAWMRRVFAWLRRTTPHWFQYETYRATEAAAQAVAGGLELVPHHGWTGPVSGRSSLAQKRKRRRI